MRRAERAVCLCFGVGLTPLAVWASGGAMLPGWVARAPLIGALALVAVVANVSAVRRLRFLGRSQKAPARPNLAVVRPLPVPAHTDEPGLSAESISDGQVVAASHALRAR
jgi:hypothetical protein